MDSKINTEITNNVTLDWLDKPESGNVFDELANYAYGEMKKAEEIEDDELRNKSLNNVARFYRDLQKAEEAKDKAKLELLKRVFEARQNEIKDQLEERRIALEEAKLAQEKTLADAKLAQDKELATANNELKKREIDVASRNGILGFLGTIGTAAATVTAAMCVLRGTQDNNRTRRDVVAGVINAEKKEQLYFTGTASDVVKKNL